MSMHEIDALVACTRCGSQHEEGDQCCIDGRQLVYCDDKTCKAFELPQRTEEVADAYAHWRYHTYIYGCSHGR